MCRVPELDGVLFFPVTPFDGQGSVDLAALAEHVSQGVAAGPGAVFVACGTGEFHALDVEEYREVVATTVAVTDRRVPVYAGTGSALPVARRCAAIAESVGADGLLLLPPYLVSGPTEGLVRYTQQVADASALPLIVYNRGGARFDAAAAAEVSRIATVAGFKDGIGDLDLLARIVLAVRGALDGTGKAFQFFNGMPTAEATVTAYRSLGVRLYSSAVFCFAPEISLAFYDAVSAGDEKVVEAFLTDFFHPLVELRETVPGYAVSLIKAAVRLRGLDVGGVRPPLVDPAPEHMARLAQIIDGGLALAKSVAGR
ncbi:5-dehydro-4-deoxyglucarate dehydratase [Micromonospora mirobrigensis]|uniref:Probable 5-dehydro-4-deoxyglucarate dehydratase n=2 Tax=Micromonospora mirobrigensis TaxID=262898 RepID=A0A1C5AKK5_9ACTN|nr:5-dehydro-4-deoxyglucarate dehydratase [Micromonospora mirobrigensis]